MSSLPDAPPVPTGLGGGGLPSPSVKRSSQQGVDLEEQRPAKQVRDEPPKKPRIDAVGTNEEVWKAIERWAESQEGGNPHAIQRLAAVMEWLDGVLDAQEVQKSRLAQLQKLWKKDAFIPIHKSSVPKGSKVFH